MKNININKLKRDERNANKHSTKGMKMLREGILKNGLGRSILLSSDDEIIAGNGVAETAQIIGIENVRVIETDGTEVIAVKRTDIKSGTREFYEMALSDNIIAKENIIMDADVVDAICEEYDIERVEVAGGEGAITEKKEYDGHFPLAIVLMKRDYEKWQGFKRAYKLRSDTDAFLKLMDEQLIQE